MSQLTAIRRLRFDPAESGLVVFMPSPASQEFIPRHSKGPERAFRLVELEMVFKVAVSEQANLGHGDSNGIGVRLVQKQFWIFGVIFVGAEPVR